MAAAGQVVGVRRRRGCARRRRRSRGSARLELAQRRARPCARARRLVGAGHEHDDLAGPRVRPARRARPARSTWRPRGAALGDGEHAGAPVLLGRDERKGAGDDHAARRASRSTPSSRRARDAARRASVSSRRSRPCRKDVGGLVGGALGRADAIHLGGDERARRGDRTPASGAAARERACAGADQLVGHAQLEHLDAGDLVRQRCLIGRRPGGDGEHGAGRVEQRQAGVEGARGRAHHLGQAGARLHRGADVLEARGDPIRQAPAAPWPGLAQAPGRRGTAHEPDPAGARTVQNDHGAAARDTDATNAANT